MKNKLQDLNDHLFAQLERICDDDLTPQQIDTEAKRSKAVVEISDQIVGAARLRVDAAKLFASHGERVLPMLPQISATVNQGEPKQLKNVTPTEEVSE